MSQPFLAAVSQLSSKNKEPMSMPSTRSNTKKLSKEDTAKAATAVEGTASKRNPVPTGTGQPSALTISVQQSTTKAAAASPSPVQDRTGDTFSVPVVPLPEGKEPITGTEELTIETSIFALLDAPGPYLDVCSVSIRQMQVGRLKTLRKYIF